MNLRLLQYAPLALSIVLAPHCARKQASPALSSGSGVANQSSESSRADDDTPPRAVARGGSELVAIANVSLAKAVTVEAGSPAEVDARSGRSEAPRARGNVESGAAHGSPATLVPAGSASRAAAQAPEFVGPAGDAVAFDDALELARASYLETGFSVADGKALVGVMRSRARRMGTTSLAAAAYSYTAIGRGFGVGRNDFARTLPDGDVPTWSAATNRRWKRLRAAVRAVVEGRAGSPCRGAQHLGSLTLAIDVRRAKRAIDAGRWRRIECAGDVIHGYYAEVGR